MDKNNPVSETRSDRGLHDESTQRAGAYFADPIHSRGFTVTWTRIYYYAALPRETH